MFKKTSVILTAALIFFFLFSLTPFNSYQVDFLGSKTSFAGAYFYENMVVEGRAEIIESFTMYNIRPGAAVRPGFRADHFFRPSLNLDADPVPESSPAPAVKSSGSPEAAERPVTIVLPNSGQGAKNDHSNEESYQKLFAFYITSWFSLF